MFDPIYIENDNLLIHSFRPEEIKRLAAVAKDVFAILSDEHTLQYVPDKRLHSVEEAEALLKGNLLRFHSGKNYLHFITEKNSGVIIGLIDIISPDMARNYYDVAHYPHFIEFYLKGDCVKRNVMSSLLPEFIGQLRKQRIEDIGAVINRNNVAAQKVLRKAGFSYLTKFDILQDFYITHSN